MSFENFKPTVWSTRLLEHLDKSHVYGDVVNRDYEGEIRGFGDAVTIGQIGDITVEDHDGTDIVPQDIDTATTKLLIDQKKRFAFKVDDVDAAQIAIGDPLDRAMARAAYGLRDVSDAHIATLAAAGAGIGYGTDGTPLEVNSANVLEIVTTITEKLNDANVPEEDRFIIIPNWFVTKLVLAEILAATNNEEMLANGRLSGPLLGFAYARRSNNVPNTASAKYKVIAGSRMAITYAEQLVKMESYRPEKSFSDAIKGLHVYGAKVVLPNALCVATVNKAAEPV